MIDYMKTGFDILEDDKKRDHVNNKVINPGNKVNRDVETAEEFYELKTNNQTDYSTETLESLEFAEDDIDLAKPVHQLNNLNNQLNKDKK